MVSINKYAITSVFALTLSFSVLAGTSNVSATPGPQGERKVIICHATNSHQNPYTVNDVDKSSIDEVNNKYLNGHGDHTGGIWHEGVTDHSWGDIIPAFTNDEGNAYPGQNWTEAGQAIYNNNCDVPGETPVEPENPGGNGGGNVLGTNTDVKGELADTGIPAFVNFIVGTAILAAAAYIVRRKSNTATNL
ncbi:MAG: hypothetical protein M3Q36_01475 [bacterium]|nr:hypothetical protein [bacterium]